MIKYNPAPDIEQRARHIAETLEIKHDFSRIHFVRSKGSQSKRTLARCHGMPRVLQAAFNTKAHYVIEVISENFDSLSQDEQTKTILHELMHVPKSMGGGFRHHDFVCRGNVDKLHKLYKQRCN
jgi:predicted metallopeptidase